MIGTNHQPKMILDPIWRTFSSRIPIKNKQGMSNLAKRFH